MARKADSYRCARRSAARAIWRGGKGRRGFYRLLPLTFCMVMLKGGRGGV